MILANTLLLTFRYEAILQNNPTEFFESQRYKNSSQNGHFDDEISSSTGCQVNLQSLLFCYILRDLRIAFHVNEIQVNPSNQKVVFRNRTYAIKLPVQVVRNCLVRDRVTRITVGYPPIEFAWCSQNSVVQGNDSNISVTELRILDDLNSVLMSNKRDETLVSNVPVVVFLFTLQISKPYQLVFVHFTDE